MAKIDIFNLSDNGFVSSLAGQKLYLYGSNDVGKTKQSTKFEKPLLLMTEAGGNAVKCPKVSIINWAQFKTVVDQLTNDKTIEEAQKKYQTIIIDTVEDLVTLAETSICKEFGVRDLSEITGRQNGYNIYRKDFKQQINKLTLFGYTVIFLGHEEVIQKTDPISGIQYEYIQPKGTLNEKSSTRFVRDLCDFCVYLKPNGINENGDTILSTAICKETKNVFARSRYAMQTFVNPFTAQMLTDAILKAIERSAEDEGAGLVEYKFTDSSYTKDDYIALIKPYIIQLYDKHADDIDTIVAKQLGDKKVSQATEEDIVSLEVIYNNLVTFACDNGIIINLDEAE